MPETLIDIFVSLVRRKMRFLMLVVGLGALGIAYAHGFSWASLFGVALAIIVLGSFWVLTSFWIWVFRSAGRQPNQEPKP